MNKSSIKNFAVTSRRLLLAAVERKAYEYCITRDGDNSYDAPSFAGRLFSDKEQEQRRQLIDRIKRKGFDQVMEEAAYTWFNRFIALRFMEVNGYLPSKVRVFSDENGLFKPEIMSCAAFVDIDGIDREKVLDMIELQQNEELFKYLIIAQCNELSAGLPYMFEKISNWTELLFPNNLLRDESVIDIMVTSIPEKDWTEQVQIIGWLYQYYNAELKDETFADLKKNIKITKERIPAATQLFTPDWIVRYMVENSLGRLWINGLLSKTADASGANEEERQAEEKRIADSFGWKYYLPEAKQTPEVRKQLIADSCSLTADPVSLRVLDPCMGSGHILVYAFDVLMQIYTSVGWTERDASLSILNNNLYGLDIDDRAGQIAYFAVMMKARKYNRRILNGEAQTHLTSISDSYFISDDMIDMISGGDGEIRRALELLRSTFADAKEYGSILNVPEMDHDALYERIDIIKRNYAGSIDEDHHIADALDLLLPLVKQSQIMSRKYDAVITNPPYMGASGMGVKPAEYIKKNYPDSKSDLFAVFIEKCGEMTKQSGYQAMITQHAWMFLSSFENLRKKIQTVDTVNMIHLGARAFEEIGGEVVQTTSFVLRKTHIGRYTGTYCRLIAPTTQQGKEDMFLSGENRYAATQDNFSKIPGSPVAYWLSENALLPYKKNVPMLGSIATPCAGLATGDNNIFQRFWFEVVFSNIGFGVSDVAQTSMRNEKWYPCNSGGEFRKWATDNLLVVNWGNDGRDIKQFRNAAGKLAARPQNTAQYFKEGLTWNKLSISRFAVKYKEPGFVFDDTSRSAFPRDLNKLYYYIGSLCSCVTFSYLQALDPTMSFTNGDLVRIPMLVDESKEERVDGLVKECINNSRADWDSFETSWDFKKHPLI